jgi:peptide/nickel transport system substrate-binding protein
MQRPLRTVTLTGTILMLATLLSACGPQAAPPAPADGGQQPGAPGGGQPAAQQIKRGGTWTANNTASWAGSDPAMGQNAYQSWYWFATYMIRREPDTWKLNGDAIEKWEFSPDGMELTLHVRKGMKWQNKPPVNGREVEARDIVYTLKSITGAQYPDMPALRFPRKSQLDDMEDVVAVDKYTVKVKMKYQSSTFLDGLAEYRSPLTPDGIREHFGGRESLATPHPDRMLTAGPFTLESFTDLTEATMKRYPDYWEKGPDGQSKPYLDTVRMVWVQDTGTQIAAFIAGQLSSLSLANPETRDQVLAARKDVQVISYQPSSCWYRLAFNTKRKPFDDVRVRQALALTLDPVQTGKTIYGEFQGKPMWRYPGILPWSFPEAMSQEELAKHPWYESPKSQATIDQAKKLMADAGLANGFEFEMMGSSGSVNRDAMALYVQQINKVFPNIKIKQAPIDNALQLERAAKGDFDVQAYCYIHEPNAVSMMKTAFHSKGGRNTPQYADPKMDDLLDRAGKEVDDAKRAALLREAQLRAYEIATFVPTTHTVSQAAFHPEARGMRLGAATAGLQMFIKEVWLDK